ncbi:hypothetical protein C900_03813 [Fulvivirga imtechensis AK7]|uniref:DinB-like domain-containing protein n=1 Tax=Fulvivirga imtechensis AK7 TaxID=1237149 RepID=L8JPI9_9BACT|nr:DUF1569 domain-containing protein [Fulvivirga imtechensis]ELR70128.1 hypothetical protein C900_03813 [Fulvivirga imtechensis AK7]
MKTVFDQSTRDELIARINSLDETSMAQWGKMNLYQMLKHCTIWDEWMLGVNNPVYEQSWLGKIFGKMALKSSLSDKPLKRNMPAGAGFTTKQSHGDIYLQKKKWMELIAAYAHYSNPNFIHDFFGKMNKDQIGIFAYKHSDHHLRQFGV